MNFRIRRGSVIGREHIRLGRNNQDGVQSGEIEIGGKKYLFGTICDGCSAGTHNEVGANLLATYICSEIPMILLMGAPIQDVPQALFMRCVGYLRGIASQTVVGDPLRMIDFVKNYLLCTVIGFVINDDHCIVFSAGDGIVVLNNEITTIDQQNKPMYLAYQLVDRAYLDFQGGELPQSFDVTKVETVNIQRLAVCSDGIVPQAIDSLWGHKNSLSLQRKLRVLARRKIPFDDDCSAIVLEQIEAEEKGDD